MRVAPARTSEFAKSLLSGDELDLFEHLRIQPESEGINDFRLCQTILAKKTKKKCLALLPLFKTLLDKYNLDSPPSAHQLDELRKFDAIRFLQFVPGARDIQGAGLQMFDYRDFTKGMVDPEVCVEFMLRMMERHIDSDPSIIQVGVTALCDMSAFGMSKFDQPVERATLEVIQDHYPARSNCFLLVDSPWYVRVALAIMRPFLTKKMRSRCISIKRSELDSWVTAENRTVQFHGSCAPSRVQCLFSDTESQPTVSSFHVLAQEE